MAQGKTGSFELAITNHTMRISWSETYDATNNRSVVSITKAEIKSSSYRTTYYLNGTIKINGTTVLSCNSSDGTHLVKTESFNVYAAVQPTTSSYSSPPWSSGNISHNSDGTKTVSIAVSMKGYTLNGQGGSGWNITGSKDITLTAIPRASSVSAAGGNIGTAQTITISKASSSFTHTLTYSFAGATGTIATKTSSSSVSWTPPMSLCSQIPSATSGTCTITCETYSGSTYIDKKTCTMTLSVPSSVKLTCSTGWATVSPDNTGTAAASISKYVSGISKAQVSFTSSKISTANSYGATISYYKIVYGSTTVASSPYRTPVLTGTGTKTLTAYVYDTRGRSVSATLSFDVLAYAKPTMKNISAYRSDKDGAAADNGTFISVKADAIYSELGGSNSITLRARYKAAGGSYSSYTTMTDNVATMLGGGSLSETTSYTVELSLSDALGNSTAYTSTIPTASVFFQGKEGGKGAAFGKFAETDNMLDVNWDLRVRGNVYGPMRTLGKRELVPEGADFNGYLTFGEFAVTGNSLSKTISNIPVTQAGVLTVSSSTGDGQTGGTWAYIIQEYKVFDGKTSFYRLCQTKDSGAWSFGRWISNGQQNYVAMGYLWNGGAAATALDGFGAATVDIAPNGIARIDYSLQVSLAGVDTSLMQHGLNRDLLKERNSNIPTITPVIGGTCTIYNSNGSVNADLMGYGGIMIPNGKFWQPAYVKNTGGEYTGWGEGKFTVGMRIVGTCYGTVY